LTEQRRETQQLSPKWFEIGIGVPFVMDTKTRTGVICPPPRRPPRDVLLKSPGRLLRQGGRLAAPQMDMDRYINPRFLKTRHVQDSTTNPHLPSRRYRKRRMAPRMLQSYAETISDSYLRRPRKRAPPLVPYRPHDPPPPLDAPASRASDPYCLPLPDEDEMDESVSGSPRSTRRKRQRPIPPGSMSAPVSPPPPSPPPGLPKPSSASAPLLPPATTPLAGGHTGSSRTAHGLGRPPLSYSHQSSASQSQRFSIPALRLDTIQRERQSIPRAPLTVPARLRPPSEEGVGSSTRLDPSATVHGVLRGALSPRQRAKTVRFDAPPSPIAGVGVSSHDGRYMYGSRSFPPEEYRAAAGQCVCVCVCV
jgi:hypothetical protein